MADRTLPDLPQPPLLRPPRVELVVPAEPLRAIGEVLNISIHDIVNEAHRKRQVAALWRLSRWIENDAWLRRRFDELEASRKAHLPTL